MPKLLGIRILVFIYQFFIDYRFWLYTFQKKKTIFTCVKSGFKCYYNQKDENYISGSLADERCGTRNRFQNPAKKRTHRSITLIVRTQYRIKDILLTGVVSLTHCDDILIFERSEEFKSCSMIRTFIFICRLITTFKLKIFLRLSTSSVVYHHNSLIP